MFEKLSQSLRGNQNAAGPHKKRLNAAISNLSSKIKGPSLLTKTKKTVKNFGNNLASGLALDAGIGATYGAAVSKGVANSLGMKAKGSALKTAGQYAMKGAKFSVPMTVALTAGSAYLDKRAEAKTIKGRAKTAIKSIKKTGNAVADAVAKAKTSTKKKLGV